MVWKEQRLPSKADQPVAEFWALAAALNIMPSEPGSSLTFELVIVLTIAPLVPVALAGAGMVWLLRRSAPVVQASR